MKRDCYIKKSWFCAAVIFDGRAVGIIDGSSEFEGRAEGVIAGSSEFEGRAEGVISADVVGLAEVGRTVGDVGFRVDGLPDVGLDVEGLFDGLAEVGFFVGLAVGPDVGLDGEGLFDGLAEVGFFVGLAVGPDVGLDVEGLFDGLAEIGFFVGLAVGLFDGLAEVGFFVGLAVGTDVGLDVEGLFDGLAEVGLFVGLAVAGILMRRDIELLGHAILFDSKMVPGARSTNSEISNTPELFTTIKCRIFEDCFVSHCNWTGGERLQKTQDKWLSHLSPDPVVYATFAMVPDDGE